MENGEDAAVILERAHGVGNVITSFGSVSL